MRAFLAGGLHAAGLGGPAGLVAPAGDVSPVYGEVAFNTLWFGVATTAASLAVALPVAHGLEKYDLPREDLLVILASFPISLPGIVAAFMIIVLLGNTGLLTNAFAALAGADPTDAAVATSLAGLFLAYLYSMVPRALLLLRGTYAEVNVAAEEAARSLGATPWQTFRYVTLPQVKPGLIGAAILTFRTALAIFGTLLILQVLSVWTFRIDRVLSTGYDVQVAGAMAILWFGFVFGLTYVGLRFTSAEVGL
jgi:putative spermidine/putrescine transport system permease protein